VAYTKGSYPTQYIKNVQKPICHECAEILVNLGPTPEEIQAANEIQEAKMNFIFSKTGCLVFLFVALLAGLFIWGVWTGVDSWLQCQDGYNIKFEEINGKRVAINTCTGY
jgi:hypothetical protein